MSQESLAGRVEAPIHRQVTEAAEETDSTVSEIVNRAIEHYIETNPDDLKAFGTSDDGPPWESLDEFTKELVS